MPDWNQALGCSNDACYFRDNQETETTLTVIGIVGPVGLEPTCTITLSAPYKSEGIRA